MSWKRGGDNFPDYYKILGVARNASETEIKERFHELARTYHPDVGGDEEAFKRYSDAHDVLTTKRDEYNVLYDAKSTGAGFAGLSGVVGKAIPFAILATQTIHHWVTIRRDAVMVMVGAERLLASHRLMKPADAMAQSFEQVRPYVDPTALAWAMGDASDSESNLSRQSIHRAIAQQAKFMREQAAEHRRLAEATIDVFQVAIDVIGPPPGAPLEMFRRHRFSDELGLQNISVGLIKYGAERMSDRHPVNETNAQIPEEYLRAVTYPIPPGMPDTNIELLLRAGGDENLRAAIEILREGQEWARNDIPKLEILSTWDPLGINLIGRARRSIIGRRIGAGSRAQAPQIEPQGKQNVLNR